MLKRNFSNAQRGISLVEVLLAMLIGAIVTAAMAALFAQTLDSRKRLDRDAQKLENGRYALDVIGDDLRLAGYYGDLSPLDASTWAEPNICATNVADLGWSASGSYSLPVPVVGYDGAALSDSDGPSCLPDYKGGTDFLVVRRVSTEAVAPSAATITGPGYIQVSTQNAFCPSKDAHRFVVSDQSADFTLRQVNCTGTAVARQLVVRVYYIAKCNVCLPNPDNIPTLKVAELTKVGGANTLANPRTVTPGIENIHFKYGLDSGGAAGSADEYVAAQGDGTLGVGKNWASVVSVKVFLLARDLEETRGYVDGKSYELSDVTGEDTVSAASDAYRRSVMSTAVRLVNVAGRRGAP